MLTFHAPSGLLKEAGLPDVLVSEPFNAPSFDQWCLQCFYRDQKKCWMFLHPGTFFTLVVSGSLNHEIRKLHEDFRFEMSRIMFYQNYSPEEIRAFLGALSEAACFRKNMERRMFGLMDELIRQYNDFADRAERSREENPSYASLQLNETPVEALDYQLPVDVFRSVVTQGFKERRKAA